MSMKRFIVTLIACLSLLSTHCNKKEVVSYIQEVYDPDRGMIFIPAGTFTMGRNDGEFDERPDHTVYLDAYYIDENPVTNAEYNEFLTYVDRFGNPRIHIPKDFPEDTWELRLQYKPRHPVVGISYESAVTYSYWAGKRLPTEAQWEKAARGDTWRKYPWGNELPYHDGRYKANYQTLFYAEDGFHKTSPVGFYNGKNLNTASGRSPYELNDMAGNVWEWIQDWYSPVYYRNSPSENPQGPSEAISERTKVIRGGSWNNRYDEVYTTTRNSIVPQTREENIGFRCVINISQ